MRDKRKEGNVFPKDGEGSRMKMESRLINETENNFHFIILNQVHCLLMKKCSKYFLNLDYLKSLKEIPSIEISKLDLSGQRQVIFKDSALGNALFKEQFPAFVFEEQNKFFKNYRNAICQFNEYNDEVY
ncbi:hypothetical protein Anas_08605 [Armadillidium nasatum]|uniref:Uncharacterized protein n=1 Tax=Armadillidium nasatum TaxID=96803 RepID=A0A5N5T6Q7_9CRUS|nr:hypothetical protein Anas_08605 [Armadillidium nasatum]